MTVQAVVWFVLVLSLCGVVLGLVAIGVAFATRRLVFRLLQPTGLPMASDGICDLPGCDREIPEERRRRWPHTRTCSREHSNEWEDLQRRRRQELGD